MSNLRNRNGRKITRGQSLVEMALILPVLLLLVLTFLDLGRAVYYYSTIGNAVRDGARYASVNKLDTLEAREKVEDMVRKYSIRVQPDVVVVCPFDDDGTNCPVISDDPAATICVDKTEYCVVVIAKMEFDPVTPFLARFFGSGNTITLSSESTMLLSPIARN